MKFLNSGEKIKELRKQLKMSQEDLQSENVTRAFISMVEGGKRNISIDTAKIITIKFNERAKTLGINLNIDENYIFRSASEDAEIYCLEKLNISVSLKDINEIIEIATKYNLVSVKAIAYCKLGDFYFNSLNYTDAFVNYNISIELYKSLDGKTMSENLYQLLGYCKFKLLQYREALLYFNYAKHYSLICNNIKVQKQSIYNMALCYKKLNKIDSALIYIDKYFSLCDKVNDFDYYIYSYILKSNCYEDRNEIDESLNIYNNLVNSHPNLKDNLLGIIYNNMGSLYLKKCNYIKSLKYFDLALKIRTDGDKANLHHTIIEKSKVFIKQKFYKEAIDLIDLGLKSACDLNDVEYLLKGKYLLADIYRDLKNYTKLKEVYLSIIDLVKSSGNAEEIFKVCSSLSIIYLEQNDVSKAKETLELFQKIIVNKQ